MLFIHFLLQFCVKSQKLKHAAFYVYKDKYCENQIHQKEHFDSKNTNNTYLFCDQQQITMRCCTYYNIKMYGSNVKEHYSL